MSLRILLMNISTEFIPCFFCGGTATDRAHLIRRSWSKKYIKMPENIVDACRTCHYIFDNKPWERDELPNIEKAKEIIKSIDETYYYLTFE